MSKDCVLLCFNVAARQVALPCVDSLSNPGAWVVTQDTITLQHLLTMRPSQFVAASVVNFLMTLVCHDAVKAAHLQTCDAETGLYPYTLPRTKATVAVMPSVFSQRMLNGTRLAKVRQPLFVASAPSPPLRQVAMVSRSVITCCGPMVYMHVH